MIDDTAAHLAFFDAAIFGDALRRFENFNLLNAPVPAIGVVEAGILLRLGSTVGYFDGRSAFQLIERSSDAVLQSWSMLVDDAIVSEKERWCDFISFAKPHTLDKNRFFQTDAYPGESLSFLGDVFETHLLLASDLLSDDEASLFSKWIGWRPSLPSLGQSPGPQWSIESFYIGFSKTIEYMQGVSDLVKGRHWGFADLGPELVEFDNAFRSVIAKRFNFSDEEVMRRYFKLAGEIVGGMKQPGPLWLDAERSLFDNLYGLLTEWDPAPFFGLPHRRSRWSVYAGAISESSTRQTSTGGLINYGQAGI